MHAGGSEFLRFRACNRVLIEGACLLFARLSLCPCPYCRLPMPTRPCARSALTVNKDTFVKALHAALDPGPRPVPPPSLASPPAGAQVLCPRLVVAVLAFALLQTGVVEIE
jgi:hypothetical protein